MSGSPPRRRSRRTWRASVASQYELVEVARRRGFREVEIIDDDLGRSASGAVARPGFERLVAWLCAGEIGAVGAWLTMSEAAKELGVTRHAVRRLLQDRVLAAEQVVPGAPYQIKASDLQDERIAAAIERKTRPCRGDHQNQLPMFPDT